MADKQIKQFTEETGPTPGDWYLMQRGSDDAYVKVDADNIIPGDTVTDAKLVYGKVRSRQGGSATNWHTPGSNTYDYSGTNVFMQVGSVEYDGVGTDSVTFPTAFSQVPLVFATVSTAVDDNCYVVVKNFSTTGFDFQVIDSAGAADPERISWLAIGQ